MFWIYLVCLVLAIVLGRWKDGRLPRLPGPWGLPLLGSLPFLGRQMNVALTEYATLYGNVYQIQIGNRRLVVLNGQRAIREATSGTKGYDFAGRPPFKSLENFGVFGEPGYLPHHRACKRISQQAMTLFGDERRVELQEIGYKAVNEFIDRLGECQGEAVDPKPLLSFSTWTIMGRLCYGGGFDIDDPEVHHILASAKQFTWATGLGVLYDYLPITKVFFGKKIKETEEVFEQIRHQSRKLAERNYSTWEKEGECRTMADFMNKTMKEMTLDASEAASPILDDDLLKKMLTELFGAGFGTTASMTRWALMLLATHEGAQGECREEIDQVVGKEGLITLDDQSRLPICMSTLAEIYRYSSMASLAITHMCIRDSEIEGHKIAAGTPVVLNLYSAHYDETVYSNPNEFNHRRYIDEETGTLNQSLMDMNMPYGLGLRRCGGEFVAKQTIFLFFSSLVHRLIVRPPPGVELDPKDYAMTLAADLKPFKLVFHKRD